MSRVHGLAKAGAWAAVAVLGAGLAGGIAYAGSAGGTSPSAPSPRPHPGRSAAGLRGLAGRTVWGQFVVRRKGGFATVDVQRGKVSATVTTGTESISVTSADGHAATYAVTATTKIREHGKAVPLSSVATGDRVLVFAVEQSNGGFLAMRIVDAGPPTATGSGATGSGATGA
ncbi:MAG TPA: hypothetical protein VNG13_02255 [Mycobacteriales bacterium]|nr:hypothetical protein [Mycobacteriales bacterium]